MALRIYMIRGSPQAGPQIGVTFYRYPWTMGGIPSPFLGSIDKNDESANGYAVVTMGVGSPGPIDATDNGLTYVYPLPTNLLLSGTVDLCVPAFADYRYQYNLVLHIWVSNGVSGLTRGTLLYGYVEPGGTNDLPPSTGQVLGVSLATPQPINTLQCYAGDYIVFEIGIIARGPYPNNGSVNYYTGCRSASGTILPDLTPGAQVDTILASHAPWFEFLQAPTPVPTPIPTCCDPGPSPAPDPTGALPPYAPFCTGGGDVDSVADLSDGEVW